DYQDTCNCTIRTCVSDEFCTYDGIQYQFGDTWKDGLCTDCSCVMASEGGPSKYEVLCQHTSCPNCLPGESYIPVEGQCCGTCVRTSCVADDGTTYEVGQIWSLDTKGCSRCECVLAGGYAYVQCAVTQCPPVDPSCPLDLISYSANGCCQFCNRGSPRSGGRRVSRCNATPWMSADGCLSRDSVNVTGCEGACSSRSVLDAATNVYTKQCSCCSATETVTVEVEMVCPDGSARIDRFEMVAACKCDASQCGANN
uniref:CTCK domain-containing protein n=1 Tax=Petromyzon marinus TaxID=7757 RepID=S4REY1_PETMA